MRQTFDVDKLPCCEEHCETYYSDVLKREMVQLDYRAFSGELFSCIAKDEATARAKLTRWLKTHKYEVCPDCGSEIAGIFITSCVKHGCRRYSGFAWERCLICTDIRLRCTC